MDWKLRAISSTNLHLRTQNIWVNSDDLRDSGYTYVVPKNLLKKFIEISDLKTQIAGFLYGISPKDQPSVKEIRSIVMVPQVGSRETVTLPNHTPESEYLLNLECLGWIHTQSTENQQMTPYDINLHARFLNNTPSWDPEKCIVITSAFTPGSCTLTAFKLTKQGYEWGKKNEDLATTQAYSPTFYEKAQLFLSDKFQGFFMVPDNQMWNYNLIGLGQIAVQKYGFILANPKDYYNEIHRTSHFLRFNQLDDDKQNDNADHEDFYA